MSFQFSGINIYSRDPVQSLNFYKALGLRVLHEPAPDDNWYGAELALQDDKDEPVIWIWRLGDSDESTTSNAFVFTTGGKLQETYGKIRAAGISCEPPATAAWGGQELILYDPDGNSLLFL